MAGLPASRCHTAAAHYSTVVWQPRCRPSGGRATWLLSSGAAGRSPAALRPTSACRMAAIAGPSLDLRIEDVVKVEETNASEATLQKVVQLLIDPQADGVERITMGEFAAMQPKRQLLAVGGRKEWLEWIHRSAPYDQAVRLAMASPAQDLAALQQAGVSLLHQWVEHPKLVQVSARTRAALDAAVEESVTGYMTEVARVVNLSNGTEVLLIRWVSDVVGKFVLDSLKISVDAASRSMWAKRSASMPSASLRQPHSSTAESAVLHHMLNATLGDPAAASTGSSGGAGAGSAVALQPVLPPGEACTLDHYTKFVERVVASVRQDYHANHARIATTATSASHSAGLVEDRQAEMEVAARSHDIIATALTQLLEQAVQHYLPAELRSLQQDGYLALDRVPGLLKSAVSLLQLRYVPLRYFVFHSTLDSAAPAGGDTASSAPGLTLAPPMRYAAGTFLTGSKQPDVALGEWTGHPDPPSSMAVEGSGVAEDAVQQEYSAVLHRLRRRIDDLATTSLIEVLARPERHGGNGFDAATAIGLDQLFGPAKLLEDRLAAMLQHPSATSQKPLHFVEAGPVAGKTALLERLAQRTTGAAGRRAAVIVRYGGSATPFLPDVDDHPLAFAARFWFRVALASCPYLIRTEELFSRAPRSVQWWSHPKNWSWERYQQLVHASASGNGNSSGGGGGVSLSTILVDDIDTALAAMELKWGTPTEEEAERLRRQSRVSLLNLPPSGTRSGPEGGSVGNGSNSAAAASRRAHEAAAEPEDEEDGDDMAGGGEDLAGVEQRQHAIALSMVTGKSIDVHLSLCFTQISAALGQVSMVFTGHQVSPLLLAHCSAPCRRYFIPLSGGVGLQPRLRMLPMMATLHALHLSHRLNMPGLLYEVLKNCPGLMGRVLELFWGHRVASMDLRTGMPRLMMMAGGASEGHPQLLQSYIPRELFAELPVYTSLLQDPRRSRRRLVELLQRQLSSPTGYLNKELDTMPQDAMDGFILPHNHTSSQVHPFALFTIFSRQDSLEERVYGSDGRLLDEGEARAEEEEEEEERGAGENRDDGGVDRRKGGGGRAASPLRWTGVGSNERKIVRAWAEVWAEYRGVVAQLSTTPRRKRDAMRVLLHGALLLRSAAVAGAQLELNLKVPSYGFPLLASEMRVRGSAAPKSLPKDGAVVVPATPDTVRRAISAYKLFFSSAAPSHFPFRPSVGLNGGCDVVLVCGSTLALYDIAVTPHDVQLMVTRFAEALLGVLHVLEKQVLPLDRIRCLQYIAVVSMDQERADGVLLPGSSSSSSSSSSRSSNGRRAAMGGYHIDSFFAARSTAAASVPCYLDYDAVLDDAVRDRLRWLQQGPLGMTKEYRTLRDLVDDLERLHRVQVMHSVVATPEEMESLFSPTLMQLVPESTVLPPYTSAVVSAEELMAQAMTARGGAAAGDEDVTGGAEDDDDDQTDYINIGEDVVSGAEVEDAASDAIFSKSAAQTAAGVNGGAADFLVADGEHLHESAALLEAMLNDQLDHFADPNTLRYHREEEEQPQISPESVDRFFVGGNGAPASPHAATSGPTEGIRPAAAAPAAAAVRGRGEAEPDSLAWLHDIITPESLVAGLRSPGSGGAAAAAVTSPLAAAAAVSHEALWPPTTSVPGIAMTSTSHSSPPPRPSSPSTDNWLGSRVAIGEAGPNSVPSRGEVAGVTRNVSDGSGVAVGTVGPDGRAAAGDGESPVASAAEDDEAGEAEEEEEEEVDIQQLLEQLNARRARAARGPHRGKRSGSGGPAVHEKNKMARRTSGGAKAATRSSRPAAAKKQRAKSSTAARKRGSSAAVVSSLLSGGGGRGAKRKSSGSKRR